MITVWGLKTCDTCRKALKWLEAEGKAHAFKDVRKDRLEAERLQRWIDAVGWETLLNRRGTTWRKLSETETANVDGTKAKALMLSHPGLIKRPVFETGQSIVVGFKDAELAALRKAG